MMDSDRRSTAILSRTPSCRNLTSTRHARSHSNETPKQIHSHTKQHDKHLQHGIDTDTAQRRYRKLQLSSLLFSICGRGGGRGLGVLFIRFFFSFVFKSFYFSLFLWFCLFAFFYFSLLLFCYCFMLLVYWLVRFFVYLGFFSFVYLRFVFGPGRNRCSFQLVY